MAFTHDTRYAKEVGNVFGEYLITYLSEPRGEVRADLFRIGSRVKAHISFPTGILASGASEPYVTALREYAREHDFADRFEMVLS